MTPEEITTIFATAATTFQPIVGQPTDDDLTNLRDVLYPLLLDIPFDDQPGGTHNLIGLVQPTATYTARWGEAFPIPNKPNTYPAIPDDATPVVRARLEAEHAIIVRDYASYEAAERAAAKFIRDNVDELWYRDLRHAQSHYTSVTAKQLMEHLETNCGGLHPVDLVSLPTEMMGYYATVEGIPEYIDKLEEAQRKLARANLPMSDDQLLAIASTSVMAAEHFPRATDEWEALPRNNKTWTAWKAHYRSAHTARKRQLLATGRTTPTFGMANAATTEPDAETFAKLDGYLDNLAAAATTEKTTLTQLVENNATLTASITSLTATVASLSAAYTLLAAGKPAPSHPTANPQTCTKDTNKKPGYLAVGGYCWSHGYRVRKGHDSATCREKKEGHRDEATRANTMNGSDANKGWENN